jgi:hypothetical protein
MVSEGRGRLFKTQGNKYFIYLPVDLAEDSTFPFKNWERAEGSQTDSIHVRVRFDSDKKGLIVEKMPKIAAETNLNHKLAK